MIGYFRSVLEALQTAAAALTDAVELLGTVDTETQDASELRARVDALERSRALWEAEMEGELQRAEGKYKASRNAEERARTMRSRAEELAGLGGGDAEGEEGIPAGYLDLLRGDAPNGTEEGVQPVREAVGRPEPMSPKGHARRLKYGG